MIHEAVRSAANGFEANNPMLVYVKEYQEKRLLAELGYRFEATDLSARKAEIFVEIASAYQKLREKQ